MKTLEQKILLISIILILSLSSCTLQVNNLPIKRILQEIDIALKDENLKPLIEEKTKLSDELHDELNKVSLDIIDNEKVGSSGEKVLEREGKHIRIIMSYSYKLNDVGLDTSLIKYESEIKNIKINNKPLKFRHNSEWAKTFDIFLSYAGNNLSISAPYILNAISLNLMKIKVNEFSRNIEPKVLKEKGELENLDSILSKLLFVLSSKAN